MSRWPPDNNREAPAQRRQEDDMQTIDQQVWDDWKAKNDNPYGKAIFAYAEKWADAMEREMAAGAAIQDIAKRTSHEADADGITGFMYGAAVSMLAQCWTHGEELRQWHNLDTQIGDEGERANADGGTLNPALLCVGK
jgi:hypothetical protein